MLDFTDYQVIKDMIYQSLMELQGLNGYIVEDIDALVFAEKLANDIVEYLNVGLDTVCV